MSKAGRPRRVRRGRVYRSVRWASLVGSLGIVFLAPLANLARNLEASAGYRSTEAAAPLAAHVPSLPIVGAPWTLSVLGLEFMDPLAGASLAFAGGLSVGALGGLLLVVALIAFFGRFFCSWICPYAPLVAASRAARGLLRRVGLKPLELRLSRATAYFVLGGLLLATAVGGAQLAPLIYPPALIAREVFSSFFYGGLGAGVLVLAAIFAFDTLVSPGGFCRSLCPGGALISLLSFRSRVRLQRSVPDCTDCGACDRICEQAQLPMTDLVGMDCDRCGRCVVACPTGALLFTLRTPAPNAGSPVSPASPQSAARSTSIPARSGDTQ